MIPSATITQARLADQLAAVRDVMRHARGDAERQMLEHETQHLLWMMGQPEAK